MKTMIPQPTEAQFRRQIIQLAQLRGWRVAGFRPAQNRRGKWATHMDGHVGFPDLFLVKDGRALALELKVGTRKATDEQLKWLGMLADVPGIWADVIYPSDWEWLEEKLKGET